MRPGLALAALLLAVATAATAQQVSRAHMEACTEWKPEGGHIGTRNDCNRPVAIKFMAFPGAKLVDIEVAPGGRFDSGIAEGSIEGFIFTVCPAGYGPSLPFAKESAQQISESLYNCLPERPES